MLSYLFVYGTLQRGQPLHHELVRARAEFVGCARMSGRLYDLGRYPGALVCGDQVIPGELYCLPEPERALRHLDTVEGRQFHRATVQVTLDNAEPQQAWVYLLQTATARLKPATPGSGFSGCSAILRFPVEALPLGPFRFFHRTNLWAHSHKLSRSRSC